MRTYHDPLRGRVRGQPLLGGLVLFLACASAATAQQRRYLAEIGAAGVYQSFDANTQLGGGTGVADLKIKVRSRWSDLLITALTAGLVVPRSVTFEGVVTR